MKLAKKNAFTIVIALVVTVMSVAIYLLFPNADGGFSRQIIGCVIVAQFLSLVNVLFYNAVSSKKNFSLLSGGYTITGIYISVVVMISALFGIYYHQAWSTYLTLIIMISVVFFVATLTTYIIGSKVSDSATNTDKACATFKNLEYKMQIICSNNKLTEYSSILIKVLEAIKACDQSNFVETDEKIERCLDLLSSRLQDTAISNVEIDNTCEQILSLIRQRGMEVNQLKRGGV